MTWTYQQSTGRLTAPDGVYEGSGYSGFEVGLNNPAMQSDPDVGPIPRGTWNIGSPIDPPDYLGPLAMALTIFAGQEAFTFGRSAFFIHGDNAAMDRTASRGCIILGRALRQAISNSADRALTVVA